VSGILDFPERMVNKKYPPYCIVGTVRRMIPQNSLVSELIT